MGCNCGRKRVEAVTSANIPSSAPDRPDIVAAREAAKARVDAVRTQGTGTDTTTTE